ncbi:MAG: hypothetical protein M1820_005296 [Bogoriella megaspora]|nr:MAG: hypothetical protein M1820_005296 [Bogoriella megaspora]
MAAVQTVSLSHLPANPLYIAAFRDVKNVSFLRDQLLNANQEFEYAFVDATLIISSTHALAACFRAINDLNANRLKTRNVHSEIVFSLSPNNNIAESFRRFGLSDNTKDIVAIKIGCPDHPHINESSVQNHLSSNVEGITVDFSDATFAETRDVPRIRKIYKIPDTASAQPKGKKGQKQTNGTSYDAEITKNEVDEIKELEAVILGMMTLKGS